MLSLLSLFLPGAVQLGMKIADLFIAKQNANTDVEKAQIDAQIKQLQAQQAVLVASMDPVTRKIYWGLLTVAASGPVLYITKIFLWDKVIGAFLGCSGRAGDIDPQCHLFNTDNLSDPNLWWITIAVFTFLFLSTRKS